MLIHTSLSTECCENLCRFLFSLELRVASVRVKLQKSLLQHHHSKVASKSMFLFSSSQLLAPFFCFFYYFIGHLYIWFSPQTQLFCFLNPFYLFVHVLPPMVSNFMWFVIRYCHLSAPTGKWTVPFSCQTSKAFEAPHGITIGNLLARPICVQCIAIKQAYQVISFICFQTFIINTDLLLPSWTEHYYSFFSG